jgi:hypothetical protein
MTALPSRPPGATSRYRVLVTDHITPGLIDHFPPDYESPPQTEQQARSLIAVLIGAEHGDHQGPWRLAIAGGQRIVRLRAEP